MREEEKKRSSQDSSIKTFFKKRWAFPAIYLASAAIILTAVLWYQNSNNASDSDKYDYEATDIAGKKYKEPAIEVNRSMENMVMPVTNPDTAKIQKQFYDFNGKAEEQEAALVFYNNTYHPNTGIDITGKDGKTFDVVAALSGTVTRVDEDSLLGNVIEIEHDKGIVTQYQSVSDFKVNVGDQVEQGQVLAKAGQSLYNEEAGIHVHFEIRKDSVAVNPLDYFNKPFSALQEAKVTETKAENTDAKKEEGTVQEENDKSTSTEPSTNTVPNDQDDKKESDQKEDDKATDDKKETDDSTEGEKENSTESSGT